MMRKTSKLFAALLLNTLLFSSGAIGEVIKIPLGQGSSSWSGETPKRGLTKAQVEAKFGSPASIDGPSGNPPIYYWEYPDFTVYFEADYVIHSVAKHRSRQKNTD